MGLCATSAALRLLLGERFGLLRKTRLLRNVLVLHAGAALSLPLAHPEALREAPGRMLRRHASCHKS